MGRRTCFFRLRVCFTNVVQKLIMYKHFLSKCTKSYGVQADYSTIPPPPPPPPDDQRALTRWREALNGSEKIKLQVNTITDWLHFIPHSTHCLLNVCTSASNASWSGWGHERHTYMEMFFFRTGAFLGKLHWFSHNTWEQYALSLCELLSKDGL
jgi:hypothetical protein